MLHAVAEYDISSVISQVKTHDHPLFRIIYESLDNTRQNPTIARALSALNFILERYTIIYTIETWHDFAHLLVDRVFTIVINDIADCDLHRLSKESLFYMIWDDKVNSSFVKVQYSFHFFRNFSVIMLNILLISNLKITKTLSWKPSMNSAILV